MSRLTDFVKRRWPQREAPIVYDYEWRHGDHESSYDAFLICIECRERGKSVPALKHHQRCMTGRRERVRRKPLPMTPRRKPRPFRPRSAGPL